MQNAEYWRERRRKMSPEQKKRESERVKSYYSIHPEKKKEQWERFKLKYGLARRVAMRVKYACKSVNERGIYSPRPWMRKPEYAPVGFDGIDVKSSFLIDNITVSQKAFAKEVGVSQT